MAETSANQQRGARGQLRAMSDTHLTVDRAHSPASTIEDTKPSADFDTAHSPGSTIEDPDNYQDRYDQSELMVSARSGGLQNLPDPRQSLNHVLSSQPGDDATPSKRDLSSTPLTSGREHADNGTPAAGAASSSSSKKPVTWIHEAPREGTEDEGSVQNDSYSRNAEVSAQPTMTVSAGRSGRTLQGNGTIGSVYSGNKIRHLKKEDGIPLWRKDIQYNFLRQVFEDNTQVFTKASDGTPGHSFADIYIDAMARSSKTSKILKDKLLQEKGPARNMAMVCLLVNVGRMNTTLNFFPEMRAQLRTYHSIPCLQAHEDPNAYKQLQDAPRLKSILKGASEDTDQPNSIEKIKERPIPRTNAVNLIFVLSQYAPRVSEMHFRAPRDFFDLVMRSTLSSASRAKAFLWLMWWYLESDFTREHAEQNPFGRGQDGEGTGGLPIKVPDLVSLREDQANAENVDTQEEMAFGEMKKLERKRILEEDEAIARAAKRPKKSLNSSILPSEDEASGGPFGTSPFGASIASRYGGQLGAGAGISSASGYLDIHTTGRLSTSYRPGSPGSTGVSPSHQYYGDEEDASSATVVPPSGRGRWKRQKRDTGDGSTRILKTKMDQVPDSTSPAPPGANHPVLNQYQGGDSGTTATQRRPRPVTQHQILLQQNRKDRARHILTEKRRETYRALQNARESDDFILRTARRIEELPDDYDTEDEQNSWGPGGLVPNAWSEPMDRVYGEEASHWSKALRRVKEVLGYAYGSNGDGKAPEPIQVSKSTEDTKTSFDGAAEEPEHGSVEISGGGDADEDLDDIDKELLGEASYGDSGVEGDESDDVMDED